jgi:hypothetical protein
VADSIAAGIESGHIKNAGPVRALIANLSAEYGLRQLRDKEVVQILRRIALRFESRPGGMKKERRILEKIRTDFDPIGRPLASIIHEGGSVVAFYIISTFALVVAIMCHVIMVLHFDIPRWITVFPIFVEVVVPLAFFVRFLKLRKVEVR